MTPDFDPPISSQPMSVGNVVSAGLRLYTNRFKQYFMIALFATLWLLLAFAALVPIIVFFSIVQDYYALLAFLIPAWIVLLLYCMSKYIAGAATIARLAFGELTNRPESSTAATRFTNSRKWGFLIIQLLVGLISIAAVIGIVIIFVILFALLAAIVGGASVLQGVPFEQAIANNPAFAVGMLFWVLGLIFTYMLVLIWLSARFGVAELPLAVEPEVGATQSIGRSWSLTQKSVWRIALILLVTFLITIPLQIVIQILTSILQAVLSFLPADSASFAILSSVGIFIVALIPNILVIPLWQSMKAVIYYDLRNRREGMGLELRDL